MKRRCKCCARDLLEDDTVTGFVEVTSFYCHDCAWEVKKLPDQPIHNDDYDVERFVSNPIVRMLLDEGGVDMNQIVRHQQEGRFNEHELAQFYQLIGYSVDGFLDCENIPERVRKRVEQKMGRQP